VDLELSEETLEELAAKAADGCAASFDKIILALQNRLFNYIFQMVHSAEDAEDLAQDTFVKIFNHLKRFDGRARFTTWAYSIARNTALNHLRARKFHEPLEEHEPYLANPIETIDPDHRDLVWMAARRLKPKMFDLLWLYYSEGFSLGEIATISGMHPVSARVLLYRARSALKKKLKHLERTR
jgi:RNA polymerase sigma-70 factor (ECF subfamily)